MKIQATPKWLSADQLEEMQGIYRRAIQLTSDTGVRHHVDHIVPLRGENVAGLHVPWNLRVVPWYENLRKGYSHVG
jgi:hypothetical protein